jgi:hypothetical protein
MAKTVTMIGLRPEELRWTRMLVALLRHPDAAVSELAQQALLYMSQAASSRTVPEPGKTAVQSTSPFRPDFLLRT